MRKLEIKQKLRAGQLVWQEILRSSESRYDHRLHGVLAVCRGLSCYQAAAVWGRSPRAVEYWVKRFNKNGFSALKENPRPGRPPKLTRAQRALLLSDLRRGPESAGLEAPRWTGALLRAHINKAYGVELGARQCQRLLRSSAD